MAPNQRATIKQVAEAAGVSIQTVSRVINNRYDVAGETRKRVQEAVDQLGFTPNAIARGLASRRSRTLGLVSYDFNDFFYSQVVTGAEDVAHKFDYCIMLGNSRCEPCEEPKYLRLLTERHVEGVLFTRQSSIDDRDHLMDLVKTGVAIVVTGFHGPDLSITTVDVDNISGAKTAVDFLIENGHRTIACITGPAYAQAAEFRLEGYRQALAAVGVAFDAGMVAEGDYSHLSGYRAMKELLARKIQFSAIFAQNDRMAIGAMSALREIGLHAPRDYSIIGYDDIPEASFTEPPLTTIRQPMIRVGAVAAELLIQRAQDPLLPPTQVLLDTELVTRDSVAPLKECENPLLTNVVKTL